MAETSWPSVAGGHVVDDISWETMASQFAADGILGIPSDTPMVYADSTGRQVKIRSGRTALVRGHGWASDPTTDLTKAISANSSGSTRTDLVVLGLDRTTWAVSCYIKAGTPGAGVPPALTRQTTSPGVWEIPLAAVAVPNGASTTNATDVTWIGYYLGPTRILYVADLTILGQIPSPVPGQLAWVAGSVNALYVWISGSGAGTGWRRVAWDYAWGAIGGKTWAAGSGNFAAGVGAGESILNMDSGAVALTAGRRYELSVTASVLKPEDGQIEMRVRDTSLTGTQRVYWRSSQITGTVVSMYSLPRGRYDCTVSETKTFLVTGNSVGSGSITVGRSGAGQVFVEVIDLGPSSRVTAL